MIVKKPTIIIYAVNPDKTALDYICEGIEEEGVLFEVTLMDSGSGLELAHKAAEDSVLGSGISLIGKDSIMQMRGLDKDKPVFSARITSMEEGRTIGANSARAIKKMPFKEFVSATN